jgi:hypothetical protein
VTFAGLDFGWAAGDNGTILHTENGGLPVELVAFNASSNEDKVYLKWGTATEINNHGFGVMRSADKGENWNEIGFVESSGQSNTPKDYGFTDNKPYGSGSMLYKLKIVDNDGSFTFSDEVSVNILPLKYTLYQNYPNPFNPDTKVKFSLPEKAKVRFEIFNILGELVFSVDKGELEAGYHEEVMNLSRFASAVYIYRMVTEKFVETKKMVLLK